MAATVAALRKGQSFSIPFGNTTSTSIRNCASLTGERLGRRYTVHKDAKKQAYTVTRVS